MGLPPPLAARLAERALATARDLFSRTLLDLVELLDLPYDTVRQILREVAARITPQPQTVRLRRCAGGGQGGAQRAGAALRWRREGGAAASRCRWVWPPGRLPAP